MCGIILGAYFDKKINEPINDAVMDQFQEQATRGVQGFGLVFIDSKTGEFKLKRSTREAKAMVDLSLNQANTILFHHRMPTSSDNHLDQTHPIRVSNKLLKHDYLVVHNGIINNAIEMKKAHSEMGFLYTTEHFEYYGVNNNNPVEKFNDSESIAIELARFIEGLTDTIGARGNAALIALQINKKSQKVEQILFTRNSSPLNMYKRQDTLLISSEGQGDEVLPDTLYSCDIHDFKLKKRPLKIPHFVFTPAKVTTPVNYGYTTANKGPIGFDPVPANKVHNHDLPMDNEPISIEEEAEYAAEETINPIIDAIMEDIKDDVSINTIDVEETISQFKIALNTLINNVKELHARKANQGFDFPEGAEENEPQGAWNT